VVLIEAHEEFVQHVERGTSKVKVLAAATIVVATLLLASYLYQLAYPLISGTRYVQVDLLDPSLIVLQLLLIALVVSWLYVGVTNYVYARRLSKAVKAARAEERELEKEIAR
jgi:hypothetical protein